MIEVNYTDLGKTPIQIEDTQKNEDKSLTFLGKKYSAGYSEIIAENFLHLLENFAFNIAPTKPVQGQIWFSTNTSNIDSEANNSDSYGLKVFDGTRWLPVGIIKKSNQAPNVENAVSPNLRVGDLYIDTSKQQLYIYNGTGYTLIGPQINIAEKTGAEVELLYDASNNVQRPVISLFSNTRRVAIISDKEFVPKSIVNGFSIIKQGITLSSTVFDATSSGTKFWGTSEKAESLVIGDEVVGSKNFLRSDQASTSNFGFNIRNNNGLSIGNDLSFSIGTEGGSSFLYNKILGSTIDFRLRKSNAIKSIVRISSTNDDIQKGSVGINNLAPEESLDVSGNIKTNGKLIVTGTDALSISTQGGLNVVGNASINGSVTLNNLLTTKNIEPDTTQSRNLGSSAKRWNNIYATNIYTGTVTASTFEGDAFTGIAEEATQFTEPGIGIQITGDVNAELVYIKTTGTLKTFETKLRDNIISINSDTQSRQEATTFLPSDILLLERANQLYKIKKSTIVNSIPVIPVGTIILFSGSSSNIPTGYLLCDGSEVLQNQYTVLFNLIGYTYKPLSELVGPPSGLLTFALPDLRTNVPIPGTNYIIYTGKIV